MYPLLTVLGGAIGVYGTLIGAGGGILLVPALLLLYPQETPNTIASISLAVVFLNAVSGTLAYGHMHRIDYRAGLLFGAATIPGAVLGAYAASLLSRRAFDLMFSVLVLALATFIIARPPPQHRPPRVYRRHVTHTLTDFKGTRYSYSFSNRLGVLLSLAIGGLSSMLGIGGGPFHVPALVYFLDFPLHVATATSQFMLLIMSSIGSMSHLLAGSFVHGHRRTLFLGVGVILGAQVGARLSHHLSGRSISFILVGGLLLIGIRLAIHAFEH
ncbi:MAG TPA: sulfite exporter TauE/SafE family protein [Alphaproteobacteria bacterium]|nr:sulfite exporter TauE/SafE family protein [Alphaproteobacteria bacterium]